MQGATSSAQSTSICGTIVNREPPQLTLDRAFYVAQLIRYNDALFENPDDLELLTLRGDSYFALEQYEAAIADFMRAIEVDPTATYPLARLGDTYQQQFRIEAAVDAYTRAIAIDSEFVYAYIKRGIAYRKIGDASELGTDAVVYRMSLDDFNTAIRLDRTNALALARRSELFLSIKDFEQSFADAQGAINIGPEFAFAHTVMANLHKGSRDFSSAFASIQTALNSPTANSGAYAYAYTMVGEMCWRIGEHSTAIEALNISQQYDSSFSATDIVFARVAIDLRDSLTQIKIPTRAIHPAGLLIPFMLVQVPNTLVDQFHLINITKFYLLAARHNPTNPFVFSQLQYLSIDESIYQEDLDIFSEWQMLATSFEPESSENDDTTSD